MHAGIPLLGVGLETLPQVWAWRPPRCGPGETPVCGPGETPQVWAGDPPSVGLEAPLGVGLETPRPDPSTSPLGVGLETCKACWNTTCNACWDTTPPVDRMTDTCKNITFANFVWGSNKRTCNIVTTFDATDNKLNKTAFNRAVGPLALGIKSYSTENGNPFNHMSSLSPVTNSQLSVGSCAVKTMVIIVI